MFCFLLRAEFIRPGIHVLKPGIAAGGSTVDMSQIVGAYLDM